MANLLKVERSLLDPNFEGYKLCLDPLAQHSLKLNEDILEVQLTNAQYSLQHVKAFGSTNNLKVDVSQQNSVYWISTNGSVSFSTIVQGGFSEAVEVFHVPDWSLVSSCEERVSVELKFVSSSHAVITDGSGKLYILITGNRTIEKQNWMVEYCCEPADGLPCLLVAATQTGSGQIDCLCVRVGDSVSDWDDSDTTRRSSFNTIIDWITLTKDEKAWVLSRDRRLIGSSAPDYVDLFDSARALALVSDTEFEFVSDSLKPISKLDDIDTDEPWTYVWVQTEDDITVNLPVSRLTGDETKAFDKSQLSYKLTSSELMIGYEDHVIVSGQLGGAVDCEESSWQILGDNIEVQLVKVHAGNMWQELVVGDKRARLVIDADTANRLQEKLAHLTSDQQIDKGSTRTTLDSQPMEDCDVTEEDSTLYIINGEDHTITQQISLGAHQYLFTAHARGYSSPSGLCLRHDVDGLLWYPPTEDLAGDSSHWKHEATFNALGYVQASKSARRFTCAASDDSWVVIVEGRHRAYLYRQPEPISNPEPLRNRKTGAKVSRVSKQQMITLDNNEPIIGVATSSDHVILATSSCLHAVTIK